jgi:TolA-binding protein
MCGCLALKADQDEIAREVAKLRKQVAEQDKLTGETVARAEKLVTELEDVLRRNQADLGLRVNSLEEDLRELRGAAENSEYTASAVKQEVLELRGDLDHRLLALEERLQEATNIPEAKTDLWAEAERQFKKGNDKGARRLWRTYESRYPQDEKLAQVRFQIGLTYFRERDFKSALGEFYRVIEESPKNQVLADSLYYSGLAFANLGRCKDAIAYFDLLRQKKFMREKKIPDVARYTKAANEQIAILQRNDNNVCIDQPAAKR